MVVYNCENCKNDLGNKKEEFSETISSELKAAQDRLKHSQENSHPGAVSLYWLGYQRALEWAKTNIEGNNGKQNSRSTEI